MFRFGINTKWIVMAVLSCFLITSSALAANFLSINSNLESVSRLKELTRIERNLDKIDSTKLVTIRESEEISSSIKAYADQTKADLDTALVSAELLAKTQGKRGGIEPLVLFEKLEQTNELRLQKIQDRASNVETQVKKGDILLDESLIRELSDTERGEFLGSLPEEVQNIYIKNQSDLFRNVSPSKDVNQNKKDFEKNQSFLPKTSATITAFNIVETISNIIVPPAYAAEAAPCIRYALQRNWSALGTCIANASVKAKNLYNQFVVCWNNASGGGWRNWIRRAACLYTFISKLA